MRYRSVEKDISEIDEEDRRISIIGTVVRKNTTKYSLTVDDGTGEIEVYTDAFFEIGTLVRVVGMVSKDSTLNLCIDAELIQDFSGFNVSLYQKTKVLEGTQ
ncbi:MAG: hypothetical protein U9N35_08760 [Euryarchaeota archaeon]|nr:hypothetical protein [Euryarchaeota archaeon]